MREAPVILYESGPVVVVAKPPGVLTQAPPGIDSLEQRVKAMLAARDGKTGNTYLGVPHRLDRPVTGAIVFARHVRAAKRLSEQLAARTVRKVYWALVENAVAPEVGTWRDRVAKVKDEPRAEIVDADHPEGREAVLHYAVRGAVAGGTWLQIELDTGRMHQIRLQGASRGHAVLGDQHYGARGDFGPPCEDPRERAIALHARELGFTHPMTGEPVVVVAPLPGFWADWLPG